MSHCIRRSYNDQKLRYSDQSLALATELAINQNVKQIFNLRLKQQIDIIQRKHKESKTYGQPFPKVVILQTEFKIKSVLSVNNKNVTEESSQGCHHYGLLGSVHGLNTTNPT